MNEEPIDRLLIGERIRRLRIRQGLTQAALAERSGVTVSTVYHAEKGASIRIGSVRKLCRGLNTSFDGLLQSQAANELAERSHVLYHASNAEWYAPIDNRRAIPTDNALRLRDPAERHRLGHLGFVPVVFNNPHLIMEEGPGTVFIEVYGRYEQPINSRVFRDAKLYCQSGAVRCQIGDDEVTLETGDMIGYRSADLRWIEPLRPLEADDPPPFLLWIGAVRVGKAVRENGRRIVVRPPKRLLA